MNVNVPTLVGMPLKESVALSVSPGGRMPPARLHEYGGTPPAAAKVSANGTPTFCGGASGEPVTMVSAGGETVTLNVRVVVALNESVTRTSNVNVPTVVGTPASTPLAPSVRPGGSAPPAIDHA